MSNEDSNSSRGSGGAFFSSRFIVVAVVYVAVLWVFPLVGLATVDLFSTAGVAVVVLWTLVSAPWSGLFWLGVYVDSVTRNPYAVATFVGLFLSPVLNVLFWRWLWLRRVARKAALDRAP